MPPTTSVTTQQKSAYDEKVACPKNKYLSEEQKWRQQEAEWEASEAARWGTKGARKGNGVSGLKKASATATKNDNDERFQKLRHGSGRGVTGGPRDDSSGANAFVDPTSTMPYYRANVPAASMPALSSSRAANPSLRRGSRGSEWPKEVEMGSANVDPKFQTRQPPLRAEAYGAEDSSMDAQRRQRWDNNNNNKFTAGNDGRKTVFEMPPPRQANESDESENINIDQIERDFNAPKQKQLQQQQQQLQRGSERGGGVGSRRAPPVAETLGSPFLGSPSDFVEVSAPYNTMDIRTTVAGTLRANHHYDDHVVGTHEETMLVAGSQYNAAAEKAKLLTRYLPNDDGTKPTNFGSPTSFLDNDAIREEKLYQRELKNRIARRNDATLRNIQMEQDLQRKMDALRLEQAEILWMQQIEEEAADEAQSLLEEAELRAEAEEEAEAEAEELWWRIQQEEEEAELRRAQKTARRSLRSAYSIPRTPDYEDQRVPQSASRENSELGRRRQMQIGRKRANSDRQSPYESNNRRPWVDSDNDDISFGRRF